AGREVASTAAIRAVNEAVIRRVFAAANAAFALRSCHWRRRQRGERAFVHGSMYHGKQAGRNCPRTNSSRSPIQRCSRGPNSRKSDTSRSRDVMTRNLLALGRFGRQEREQLSLVAIESGHQLTLVDQVSAAAEYLENAVPHAILIDTRLPQSETFGLSVRAQSAHALTPVLGLVEEATDLAFADTFSWGGDDVVDLRSERSLLSRLRRLPHEHAVPASAHRGVAVVADPDRDRRLVRARVLRNAGYQIQFAVSADELSQGVENSPTLIVVDEELDGIAECMESLPGVQPDVTFLVMAAPRHLGRLNARLSTRHNAVAADGFAPPENLI